MIACLSAAHTGVCQTSLSAGLTADIHYHSTPVCQGQIQSQPWKCHSEQGISVCEHGVMAPQVLHNPHRVIIIINPLTARVVESPQMTL